MPSRDEAMDVPGPPLKWRVFFDWIKGLLAEVNLSAVWVVT
jgi:hypothetical protein